MKKLLGALTILVLATSLSFAQGTTDSSNGASATQSAPGRQPDAAGTNTPLSAQPENTRNDHNWGWIGLLGLIGLGGLAGRRDRADRMTRNRSDIDRDRDIRRVA